MNDKYIWKNLQSPEGKYEPVLVSAPILCTNCNGEGLIQKAGVWESCPVCNGRGKHDEDQKPLPQIGRNYQGGN